MSNESSAHVAQVTKVRAAQLSIFSNTVLVALKIVIGLMIGSVSVISEAIHSAVDLLAACIAWFAVRHSGKPADEDHHYGHGKVENISGTIEALLIFLAAGWIIYEAVGKLLHPGEMENPGWGVLVMAFSASANWFVSAHLFKVGKATDSLALQADAWHLRTDVYTSGGVMVGLLLVWIGSDFIPVEILHLIDPTAAIIVALLIIKAAWTLTIESGRDLLDVKLPPDEENRIKAILSQPMPGCFGWHDLRTRKSGMHRFIEFHLEVSGEMTTYNSHALAKHYSEAVRQELPNAQVIVHVDPEPKNRE